MAKKYFGNAKNDKSNMPQEVYTKSYPKKGSAFSEGTYVDTQEGLDRELNKAISKVRKNKY